jgi:hypothetical protein
MPATYEPIATYTFDGTSGGYTFSSIPQTYTDLVIVTNVRNAAGGGTSINDMGMTFNSLGSVYSWTVLQGDGSSATSSRASATYYMKAGIRPQSGVTSGIFASNITHIFNYSNTSTNKSMITRSACDLNGSGVTVLGVGLIGSTQAITSVVSTTAGGGNLASGSNVTIYGIKAA